MFKTESFFLQRLSVVEQPLSLWQDCAVRWAPAGEGDQKRFGRDFSRLAISYPCKQKGCLCKRGGGGLALAVPVDVLAQISDQLFRTRVAAAAGDPLSQLAVRKGFMFLSSGSPFAAQSS